MGEKENFNLEDQPEEGIPERGISEAESMEELYDILHRMKEIEGSKGKVYTAEDLIARIGQVMMGREKLDIITSSAGLREKVKELIEKMPRPKQEKYPELDPRWENKK